VAVDVSSLARALADAIGREAVSLDPEELERYAWDALGPNRAFRLAASVEPQPLLAAKRKARLGPRASQA